MTVVPPASGRPRTRLQEISGRTARTRTRLEALLEDGSATPVALPPEVAGRTPDFHPGDGAGEADYRKRFDVDAIRRAKGMPTTASTTYEAMREIAAQDTPEGRRVRSSQSLASAERRDVEEQRRANAFRRTHVSDLERGFRSFIDEAGDIWGSAASRPIESATRAAWLAISPTSPNRSYRDQYIEETGNRAPSILRDPRGNIEHVLGMRGAPPVGWSPEREGINPVQYASEVAAEVAVKSAFGLRTLAKLGVPAILGSTLQEGTKAATGVGPDELVEAAIPGTRARREWNTPNSRAVRAATRSQARGDFLDFALDVAAFSPRDAWEILNDPIGKAVQDPFNTLTTVSGAASAPKDVSRAGAGVAARVAQGEAFKRLEADLVSTAESNLGRRTRTEQVRDGIVDPANDWRQGLPRRTQEAIERGETSLRVPTGRRVPVLDEAGEPVAGQTTDEEVIGELSGPASPPSDHPLISRILDRADSKSQADSEIARFHARWRRQWLRRNAPLLDRARQRATHGRSVGIPEGGEDLHRGGVVDVPRINARERARADAASRIDTVAGVVRKGYLLVTRGELRQASRGEGFDPRRGGAARLTTDIVAAAATAERHGLEVVDVADVPLASLERVGENVFRFKRGAEFDPKWHTGTTPRTRREALALQAGPESEVLEKALHNANVDEALNRSWLEHQRETRRASNGGRRPMSRIDWERHVASDPVLWKDATGGLDPKHADIDDPAGLLPDPRSLPIDNLQAARELFVDRLSAEQLADEARGARKRVRDLPDMEGDARARREAREAGITDPDAILAERRRYNTAGEIAMFDRATAEGGADQPLRRRPRRTNYLRDPSLTERAATSAAMWLARRAERGYVVSGARALARRALDKNRREALARPLQEAVEAIAQHLEPVLGSAVTRRVRRIRLSLEQAAYAKRNRMDAEIALMTKDFTEKEFREVYEVILGDFATLKIGEAPTQLNARQQRFLDWYGLLDAGNRDRALRLGMTTLLGEWMRRYQALRIELHGLDAETASQAAMAEEAAAGDLPRMDDILLQSGGPFDAAAERAADTEARRASQQGDFFDEAAAFSGFMDDDASGSPPVLSIEGEWWRDQMRGSYEAQVAADGRASRISEEQFHYAAALMDMMSRVWARETGRDPSDYYDNLYGALPGWSGLEVAGATPGAVLYQSESDGGFYSRLERSIIATPVESLVTREQRGDVRDAREAEHDLGDFALDPATVLAHLDDISTTNDPTKQVRNLEIDSTMLREWVGSFAVAADGASAMSRASLDFERVVMGTEGATESDRAEARDFLAYLVEVWQAAGDADGLVADLYTKYAESSGTRAARAFSERMSQSLDAAKALKEFRAATLRTVLNASVFRHHWTINSSGAIAARRATLSKNTKGVYYPHPRLTKKLLDAYVTKMVPRTRDQYTSEHVAGPLNVPIDFAKAAESYAKQRELFDRVVEQYERMRAARDRAAQGSGAASGGGAREAVFAKRAPEAVVLSGLSRLLGIDDADWAAVRDNARDGDARNKQAKALSSMVATVSDVLGDDAAQVLLSREILERFPLFERESVVRGLFSGLESIKALPVDGWEELLNRLERVEDDPTSGIVGYRIRAFNLLAAMTSTITSVALNEKARDDGDAARDEAGWATVFGVIAQNTLVESGMFDGVNAKPSNDAVLSFARAAVAWQAENTARSSAQAEGVPDASGEDPDAMPRGDVANTATRSLSATEGSRASYYSDRAVPLPNALNAGDRGYTTGGGYGYSTRITQFVGAGSPAAAMRYNLMLARLLESKGLFGQSILKPTYDDNATRPTISGVTQGESLELEAAWHAATQHYGSGHWNDFGRDIWGHVRSTVHRMRDGTHTLIVEEVQSDFVQGAGPVFDRAAFEAAAARYEEAEEDVQVAIRARREAAERRDAAITLASEEWENGPYQEAMRRRGLDAPLPSPFRALVGESEYHAIERHRAESVAREDQTRELEVDADRYINSRADAIDPGAIEALRLAQVRVAQAETALSRAANEYNQSRRGTRRASIPWDADRAYEDNQILRLLTQAAMAGTPSITFLPGAAQAFRNQHYNNDVIAMKMKRPTAGAVRDGDAKAGTWISESVNTRTGKALRVGPGKTSGVQYDIDLETLALLLEPDLSAVGGPAEFEGSREQADELLRQTAALWNDADGKDPLTRLAEFEASLRSSRKDAEEIIASGGRSYASSSRPEPHPVDVIAKMRLGFESKGRPWSLAIEMGERAKWEKRLSKSWAEIEAMPRPEPAMTLAEEAAFAKDAPDDERGVAIKLFWLRQQADAYRPLAERARGDRSAARRVARVIMEKLELAERMLVGEVPIDNAALEFETPETGPGRVLSDREGPLTKNASSEDYDFRIEWQKPIGVGGSGSKDYYDRQLVGRAMRVLKRTLLENGAPKEAVEAIRLEFPEVDFTLYTKQVTKTEPHNAGTQMPLLPLETKLRSIEPRGFRKVAYYHDDALARALEDDLTLGEWIAYLGGIDAARKHYTNLGLPHAVNLLHPIPSAAKPPEYGWHPDAYHRMPTLRWGHDLTRFLGEVPLFQTAGRGPERHSGSVKGAVEFLNLGRATMRMFSATDATTLVHESAHIFRRFLPPRLLEQAERTYGVTGSVWSIDAEERFARNFERFLLDGRSPDRVNARLFRKFAGWLGAIYSTVWQRGNVGTTSPAIRRLFADMLGMDPEAETIGDQGHEPFPVPFAWGEFGTRMQRARERFDMTVDEAASRSGIAVGQLREIESGARVPSDSQLAALAVSYHMDADTIIDAYHKSVRMAGEREAASRAAKAITATRQATPPTESRHRMVSESDVLAYEDTLGYPSAMWNEDDWNWVLDSIERDNADVPPPDDNDILFQREQRLHRPSDAFIESLPPAHRAVARQTADIADVLAATGRRPPMYFPWYKSVRFSDLLAHTGSLLRAPRGEAGRYKRSRGSLYGKGRHVSDIGLVLSRLRNDRLKSETFVAVMRRVLTDEQLGSRIWDGDPASVAEDELLVPLDAITEGLLAKHAFDDRVTQHIADLGLVEDAVEAAMKELIADGRFVAAANGRRRRQVHVVKKAVAEALRSEYSGAPKWVRLLIDQPNRYWVMGTLSLRPAWLMNNILGHAMVTALSGLTPRSLIRAMLVKWSALTPEDMHVQAQGRAIDNQQPHLGRAGLSTLGQLYTWLDSSPVGRVLHSWAATSRAANDAVDRVFRRAHYIQNGVRRSRSRHLQGLNTRLLELTDEMSMLDLYGSSPETAEKVLADVTYWMGDYAQLNTFERMVVRRGLPFWSFLRYQLVLIAGLPQRAPYRTMLLAAIARAREDEEQERQSRLPEYLQDKGLVHTGVTITSPESGRRLEVWLSTQGWNILEPGSMGGVGEVRDLGDFLGIIAGQTTPMVEYPWVAASRRTGFGSAFTEPGTIQSDGRYYRRLDEVGGYKGRVLKVHPDVGLAEVQPPIPGLAEHYAGSFPQVQLVVRLINPRAGYSAEPFSLENARRMDSATERTRVTEMFRYFTSASFVLVDPERASAYPISRSNLRRIVSRLESQRANHEGGSR